MRIGEINKDNYMDYIKLFGGKNSKFLNEIWGKDKENKFEKSQEEEIEMLIKQGYIMEGMYHKEGDVSWKKTVSVSDEIKDKILKHAKSEFINNNGMTDGEALGTMIRDYIKNRPINERASASWTLQHIFRDESQRLGDVVRANVPNWQNGQPFDKSILEDYISGGIDIKT